MTNCPGLLLCPWSYCNALFYWIPIGCQLLSLGTYRWVNTYSTMIFSRYDLPVSIPFLYANSLILELSFPSPNRMMEVMHFP